MLIEGTNASERLNGTTGSDEIFGFGGPRLEAAGGTLLGNFTRFSVTGLTEALRVLPRSFAMLRRLGFRTFQEIDEERQALKAIRGDYRDIQPGDGETVLRAVRA